MPKHRPEWVREMYRHIGHQIRKARIEKHLSQKGLADLLRLNRPIIANMEHGRQGIDVFRLTEIARILDLKFEDLIPKPPGAYPEHGPVCPQQAP